MWICNICIVLYTWICSIVQAETCIIQWCILCHLCGSRHIFLGFTKCGRYVLSYTSDCGEDDDFSFYTYHLYWWEFNLHSRLKQVKKRKKEIYSSVQTDNWCIVWHWRHLADYMFTVLYVRCLRCTYVFRSTMCVCLPVRKSTVTCTWLCASGQMTTPKLSSLASSKEWHTP